MAFVSDEARDGGLDYINSNADRLDICSQEPTTYAQATSTYSLGNAVVNMTGPANASGGGRAMAVPAITDADITATGTATHWALTNGSNTLIATGPLSSSTAVVSGGVFSISAAAAVIIRDAT